MTYREARSVLDYPDFYADPVVEQARGMIQAETTATCPSCTWKARSDTPEGAARLSRLHAETDHPRRTRP